jgi:hypothetical protein
VTREPLETRISRADQIRLIIGFVVQPFAASVLGFAIFPLVEWSRHALHGGQSTRDALHGAIAFGLGAGMVAFFVTVCAVLPIVLMCLERGPLTLKQVLLSGAALGNAPGALVVFLSVVTGQQASGASWFWSVEALRALAIGSLFGLAGAALFWAVSMRGRAVSREQKVAAQRDQHFFT